MVNRPPFIFDRHLLNRRRYRAFSLRAEPDFLFIQAANEIESRLQLIKREFPLILDMGEDRGLLTDKLLKQPGVRKVVRAETILEMLQSGSRSCLVCDFELLPFGDNLFDLVTSVLALHSINDLPGTLVQIRRLLKPDGLFLALFLGGQTLTELREVFLAAELEVTGGAACRVAPFADVREIGALLQRAGFALPVVDSDKLLVTYADIFSLMHDLRTMGMTNVLHMRSRIPLCRTTVWRAAELYAERFGNGEGGIFATFELINVLGWKPHPSQQQPLRPGSARMNLADVLGGGNILPE